METITRFPPEPSGHLHVGHLKAIIFNLKKGAWSKNGKTILRFDDTNPSTARQEYVDSILEILKKYNLLENFFKITYSSDYFETLLNYQKELIEQGLAYFDYSSKDEISLLRGQKKPSPYRDRGIEENLSDFDLFLKGKLPDVVLRLKINYQSSNSAMRDPISYRFSDQVHYRTGNQYLVYPTYDWACHIIDSLEGVTLAMRTTEYNEKEGVGKWIQEKLGLRIVKYQTYSRLQFEYSLLSKRKIKKLIDDKRLSDFDDPRLDTLSGLLARGILPETFFKFFDKYGITKGVQIEEWDKVYHLNRNLIDQIAPRVFAIGNGNQKGKEAWTLMIRNLKESQIEVPINPKKKEIGNTQIAVSSNLIIDHYDASLIKEGDFLLLLNWNQVKVDKIDSSKRYIKGEMIFNDSDKKLIKEIPHKISWLDERDTSYHTIKTNYYPYLLTEKSLTKEQDPINYLSEPLENNINLLVSSKINDFEDGEIVQLIRFGFYKIKDTNMGRELIYIREPANRKQYLLDKLFK